MLETSLIVKFGTGLVFILILATLRILFLYNITRHLTLSVILLRNNSL